MNAIAMHHSQKLRIKLSKEKFKKSSDDVKKPLMVLEVRDLVLLLGSSEEVGTRGLLRFWSCSSP